jgi:nucleoid-associated protein YgaU
MIYDSATVIRFSPEEQALVSPLPAKSSFEVTTPYTIRDGDNVFSMANQFYGDTQLWFLIPEANPYLDIFDMRTGTNILIPRV